MAVYYSKTEEEHPVFHLWMKCPEGEKIDPKNQEWALFGRSLCEECAHMVAEQ